MTGSGCGVKRVARWRFRVALSQLSVSVALGCCPVLVDAQAEKAVKWTAMSQTAMSITGDVETTADQLIIGKHRLKLALVRNFGPKELGDASQLLDATLNGETRGALYRTAFAAGTRLQGSNTLCGAQRTSWVVMLHTVDQSGAANLNVAFFAGEKQPDLTPAVIGKSTDLCGTFWYQR